MHLSLRILKSVSKHVALVKHHLKNHAVVSEDKGIKIIRSGKEKDLEQPKLDPYWILAKKLSKSH
jgi:hypothetical protein